MGEAEQKLKDEIDALLKQAAEVDAAEDEKYGKGCSGNDLPGELARRQSRLAKLQAAKAAFHPSDKDPSLGTPELEAEARQCPLSTIPPDRYDPAVSEAPHNY
jgi:hypothetical protein